MTAAEFHLRIVDKRAITPEITEFTLGSDDARALPAATPGCHITVATPSGARRRYSVTSADEPQNVYRIAVKRESTGRGGSVSLIDNTTVGDRIAVQAPQNDFALLPEHQCLFIAGGIGITPILSMIRHRRRNANSDFTLYYLTRDVQHTAFMDEITAPDSAGITEIHHDHGKADGFFDLWPVLEQPDDRHIYYCGPQGLMDDIQGMTGHWPSEQVHFESFAPTIIAINDDNQPFTIVCQRSNQRVNVGADQSALTALRQAGIDVLSSCESGTCGSCKTPLIAGDVNHRDLVLSPQEQASHIMLCVSRARHEEIVVDL